MDCNFLRTLNGQWINLQKVLNLYIYEDEGKYYVFARSYNEDRHLHNWTLSVHDDREEAQNWLDHVMFHFGPVPCENCDGKIKNL